MTTPDSANPPAAPSPGAAIYVDTENLRDSDHAQSIVERIIDNWPADHRAVGSISLYVRADKEALWRLWAESAFPALDVRVRGVQHFSNHRAKNSADLAITADAVADLITGRVSMVAVVSNDSDFGALFVKIDELARGAQMDRTPFLWVTAPDAGGVSDEIEQFIPRQFRWDLSDTPALPAPPAPAALALSEPPSPEPSQPRRPSTPSGDTAGNSTNEAIAEELIRQLPVGKFKAADAHQVVRGRWPQHPAAGGAAKMGQFLLNQLWPILQKRGVEMPRKSSPRTYEITQAAKDTPAKPAARSTVAAKPASESTLAQLAASVTRGIPDDIFKASDAQNVLKDLRPDHPAASYTATQFGTWFARQLWPIMEQHGVVLASEKPRRYEMTPDARHRLNALVSSWGLRPHDPQRLRGSPNPANFQIR